MHSEGHQKHLENDTETERAKSKEGGFPLLTYTFSPSSFQTFNGGESNLCNVGPMLIDLTFDYGISSTRAACERHLSHCEALARGECRCYFLKLALKLHKRSRYRAQGGCHWRSLAEQTNDAPNCDSLNLNNQETTFPMLRSMPNQRVDATDGGER